MYNNPSTLDNTPAKVSIKLDIFTPPEGPLPEQILLRQNIKDFLKAHRYRDKRCAMTMLTFNTETPSSCGIVEVDGLGVVTGFHEKKQSPPGKIANGAIYAFDQSFLTELMSFNEKITDFSNQVIPKFLGRIQSWHTNSQYIDIGTPNSLDLANQVFRNKI